MKKKYILFSLSFGVLAILRGKIKIEEVQMVVAATKFEDLFNEALDQYASTYWSDYTEEQILEVLNGLTVIQPRLSGGESAMIGQGFCLDVITQTWSKPL